MHSPHPPSGQRPSVHPPSPRVQRAVAARSVGRARTPSGNNYFLRHWRGDLPLAAAVIISSALLWLALQGLLWLQRRFPLTESPELAAMLWLGEMLLLMGGVIWWGRGVQRAAVGHVNSGGSALVALAAGLVGVAAFFWVGAYWWLAARHMAPDVWATLSGRLMPAVVTVEPGSRAVRVTGDLEFGSTRALRQALDANPTLVRVHLDSRGGRVKEGLALGALLRDRGVDTLVTSECSSACVTAFAGGTRRLITADARLGLHSAGGAGASQQAVDAANQSSDTFIASRGVDLRVLEKGAGVANTDIWFPPAYVLLASGLATHYANEVQ